LTSTARAGLPTEPEQKARERAAYIAKWDKHLDREFGGKFRIEGSRILVVGSGWGSEVLWLLQRGAREVVGVDPTWSDRRPLEIALDAIGRSDLASRFALHAGTAVEAPDIGVFDHVITNNAMEHVFGLSSNLAALSRFIPQVGGRVFVFADPLFYSSMGHHLPVGPWEHLSASQADVRARVGPHQWQDYTHGLNGMTLTDFLGAVREAGMVLLDLGISPDVNLSRFNECRLALPPAIKPMDLCLEGIRCTLAFPQNL